MSTRLANIHLAPEEDDEDLYGGFEEYDPTQDVEAMENDETLREAVKTSYGKRPHMVTGKPPATGRKPLMPGISAGRLKTAAGRPVTGLVAADASQARPMTSVKGAGFTSQGDRAQKEASSTSKGAVLERKPEDAPEEQMKILERKVNDLVEESAKLVASGNKQKALEKAKEAGRLERTIIRQREQGNLGDQNLDLTYWVVFNLAMAYYSNQMYTQALNSYMVIVRNKTYTTAGRLRLNMGNIYYEQGNYTQAIKMYRMALDKYPTTHQFMRMKIAQNIGLVLIKTGRYLDAVSHLDMVVAESPNFDAAMNLVLCHFALGDVEKMKQTFLAMLQISMGIGDDDRYFVNNDDHHSVMVHDAIKDDRLRRYEEEKKKHTEHCIVTAARVIAPAIEASFAAGFDWCAEAVRSSPYANLVSDLEITKAVTYLKMKEHRKAIETLKDFEKKDSKITSAAATNLSFMFFLDGDTSQADAYAEKAIQADHYNPAALVNKGNCSFVLEDHEKAREHYLDALSIESSCIEALFNLGLVNKKLDNLDEALATFGKLNNMLPSNPQALYQIGDLYARMGMKDKAIARFTELQTLVPTDPTLLARLGRMHEEEGDKSMAFQCFQEANRYYPCDIDVISWLGTYYVEAGTYERAMVFFAHAAALQPDIVRWQLMVATCHRRSGNYQEALDHYKASHERFPDNVDCLRFLHRMATDMKLDEAQEYGDRLHKAERAQRKAQKAMSTDKEDQQGEDEGRAKKESTTTSTSGGPGRGKRRRRSNREDEEEAADMAGPADSPEGKTIDASYTDPLKGLPERPKTAAHRGMPVVDDFGTDDLDDDLLPE